MFKRLKKRDYYLSFRTLKIVLNNRKILKNLGDFVEDKYLTDSKDLYGVGKNKLLINKRMGLRLSHIDLMQILTKNYNEKIIYTEIGVSVLKNFFLLANFLNGAEMYAFDRNKIYKKIEKHFDLIEEYEFAKKYNYHNNEITYFVGNVYSERDFDKFIKIQNKKTNFIFSDADHSEEGIFLEYKNYYSKNLDENFIIYFDDINSATYPALEKIISDLRKNRKKQIYAYTFWINGWLGKHQNQHKNAILSTFDIENFLMNERIKLKNFKTISY